MGPRRESRGDLGVRMGAENLRAFHANGPVAKRRAFGGAGGDADVLGHEDCP